MISYFQWRAMRDQLRTTERAWLAVCFDHPFQPQPGKMNRVILSIENTGQSFAKVKRITAEYGWWNSGLFPTYEWESKPREGLPIIAIVSPGTPLQWETRRYVDVSQEDIRKMLAGDVILDLHGQIVYDDIFGCRHLCCHKNPL